MRFAVVSDAFAEVWARRAMVVPLAAVIARLAGTDTREVATAAVALVTAEGAPFRILIIATVVVLAEAIAYGGLHIMASVKRYPI